MKKVLALLVLASMTLSLVSCASSAQTTTKSAEETGAAGTTAAAATTANSTEKLKYAIVGRSSGNPYVQKEMDGFKQAIEKIGGEAILKAPEAATAEGQIAIINELISQEVAAIAVASNDSEALKPVLKKAAEQGIKILSLDSAVSADSRSVHINQADPERIGRVEVQAMAEMLGYKGQIAILSATAQSENQNTWIEWMKKELEDPKYKDMELVAVVYGDDEPDKSVTEMEGLLNSYPELAGVISPTTVGIAAAGKVLTDKGLAGKVKLTGLGLPSEMAEYIENGACDWMYLWNPSDVGYLAGYTAEALVKGTITGAEGDTFNADTLGEKTVITVGDGTEIMLGDPYKFDKSNIGEWKTVY